MKYLNRPIEIKAVNEDGLFSGYASVFEEIDSYRDIVKRGAFEKTLAESESKGRAVPILWQHDAAKPIGVYTELKEDEHGLYVEGQLNMDVQQAREALSLLRQKALSGITIGYNSVRYNTDVKTILADGQLPSLPEFEDFLCEAGFSRSQAKAIAGNGLTKLIRREVGSDEDDAIQRALAILKS